MLSGMVETPKLTVDVLVRLWEGERLRGIVLVDRRNPPRGLALPGGFVEVGERVEVAARREIEEETGLKVRLVSLLGVYSDPGRDPRFHTVSVVFVGDAAGEPRAGSDAKRVRIFPLEEVPLQRLVFDHSRIVADYLRGGCRILE